MYSIEIIIAAVIFGVIGYFIRAMFNNEPDREENLPKESGTIDCFRWIFVCPEQECFYEYDSSSRGAVEMAREEHEKTHSDASAT